MRNISQLVASLMLMASQASVPFTDTISAAQSASQTTQSVLEVRINTNTVDPVSVVVAETPDYNTEVLAPLREAQAKAEAERVAAEQAARAVELAAAEAAAAAAAQAKLAATKATPVVVAGTDSWAQLRYCEAGGDYTKNTGNGYYGAYQYNLSTWANYGGFSRPDLAPPAVQDAKAQATQAARGWSPWPSCARKLGLL